MAENTTDRPELRGNPDGFKSLAKYSKLPVERIRYYPDADENVVRAIGRGILFQIAFWSGPAFAAFAKLTGTIAKLDPESKLEFVVVDIDGSAAYLPCQNPWAAFEAPAKPLGSETVS